VAERFGHDVQGEGLPEEEERLAGDELLAA